MRCLRGAPAVRSNGKVVRGACVAPRRGCLRTSLALAGNPASSHPRALVCWVAFGAPDQLVYTDVQMTTSDSLRRPTLDAPYGRDAMDDMGMGWAIDECWVGPACERSVVWYGVLLPLDLLARLDFG